MKKIAIALLLVSLNANAGVAGAAAMIIHWKNQEGIKDGITLQMDKTPVKYDCRIAEISPDVPAKVKDLCRKYMASKVKQNGK